MKDTFLLKIIFKGNSNLHQITSAVESVGGARIQRLNFISRGKDFVGTVAVEAVSSIDFQRIVYLIRRLRDISEVELINDASLSVG